MYRWLLLISITIVSTTMLAFLSAYLAILPETQTYYQRQRSDILLFSNSFNIFYMVITPFIFHALKKYYTLLIYISVILTAIGCVGRYLCFTNYEGALFMTILVAIGHIPIISAPYGILELFKSDQKGYASSICLFVPVLGINFSILYGMNYIAGEFNEVINFDKHQQINNLNLILAIAGMLGCLLTCFSMYKLRQEIKKINQNTVLESQNQSVFQMVKKEIKGGNSIIVCLVCWGIILGFNWTYGGMFGVFLSESDLPHSSIAMIGLAANISTVIFSNLGIFLYNYFRFFHRSIIFYLNFAGFLASLYICASVSVGHYIFQNWIGMIIAIVILRAGFSAFVALALMQLQKCGPPVLISSLFFYIANISNLLTIYLVDWASNALSLTILSFLIWLCISIIEYSTSSQQSQQWKQREIHKKDTSQHFADDQPMDQFTNDSLSIKDTSQQA